MRDETLPVSHFEALYERTADPWNFATSSYEAAKYAATLAALPRSRYRHGLEVGCSIGVFTAALAARCDDLLAIEPVASALDAARAHNADKTWVRFAQSAAPDGWPQERFDLVVLSEVLDYLDAADLDALVACLQSTLEPDADAVLVHWVGKKSSVIASPDESSEILIQRAARFLRPLHQTRNADYRLDVLRRFA